MPKPSFGCMVCRRRRVKCDERIGGCVRCERYGTLCPGYQDPFDVVLRHQDSSKITSDNHTPLHGFGHERGQDSTWPSTRKAYIRFKPQFRLIQQPTADLDQLALDAFYTAYCVSSSSLVSLAYLRKQGNGCLWAAIKLLGMMQLYQNCQWNKGGNPLLKQYSEGTALLNAALSDPSESRDDSTLLATFMLSVVEMKQSPDFTLSYWSMHTSGAAALMNLRGANQILTRLGAALYLQLSSQLVIYSILGHKTVPLALKNLREEIQLYLLTERHPLWDWHGIMYRFADFWATATDAMSSENLGQKGAEAFILEGFAIHKEIELVFRQAGAYWGYSTQRSECFIPLIEHEHIYHSLLTARVWNDRRIATVLIFSVVAKIAGRLNLEMLLGSDFRYDSVYLKSYACRTIQETAKEILAAVPQAVAGLKGASLKAREPSAPISNSLDAQGLNLCYSSSEYDEHVFLQRETDSESSNCEALPYMDTCRVQWALYFAVECEFVHPQIRSCLLQALETSGKILQIQQWQILADKVKASFADI